MPAVPLRRNRDFVLLQAGQFLSSAGTQATAIAYPLLALALTHSAVKAGLALNPTFSISRARAPWTARSDDPRYLAQLEPIFEGMREAGVPEQ